MATLQYEPGRGLGPIDFGARRDDVLSLLGEPRSRLSFGGEEPLPGQLGDVLNASGKSGLRDHLAETYRGQVTDIYNEGDIDEDREPGRYDYASNVTYVNGTVSKIESLDCADAILLDGIDLCGEDTFEVILAVHARSPKVYYDGDLFFFPNLGVILAEDPDRQRYVGFTDGRSEATLIADGTYEEMTPEEFEAYFDDDGFEDDEGRE